MKGGPVGFRSALSCVTLFQDFVVSLRLKTHIIMIKAVFFDFDGTLADTTAGILATFKATLRELGLPEVSDEEVIRTIGLPLSGNFRVACGLEGERNELACSTYRRLFPEVGTSRIVLYDGVMETLRELKDRGLVLAVASSRHLKSLVSLSEMLGIRHFFSEIYGVDCSPRPKPAPDTVLGLLDVLGLKAEETLVVGDTVFDLQMGHAAGCRVCGVTYGNQQREQLATESPEFIVDNLRSLLRLI